VERRRLPRWKKVLLGLLPLLVLLALAELGFRVFAPRAEMQPAEYVERDPDLIWRLKPTASGPYQTNELGLRDAPFRADADVKVLLLGDSVSWGDGIRDPRMCYPFLLERNLEQADPARRYEVINSGVPGYSTFQELGYLERHGLNLHPDLIVLQFCLNDVVERYGTVAAFGGDAQFLGIDTRASIGGPYGWLLRHSRAFEAFGRFVQGLARDREAYAVEKMARDTLSPELEDAWALALLELEKIRDLARQHRIPLLLVIVPYAFQLEDPRGLRQPQERLIRWANAAGVPWIDLLPAFGDEKRYPLFKDPSHFTVQGHAFAAYLLAPALRSILAAK
jgi:lysophospholipase L1-like esterase